MKVMMRKEIPSCRHASCMKRFLKLYFPYMDCMVYKYISIDPLLKVDG